MSQNSTSAEKRTEPKRFGPEDEFDATDLSEGDRIPPSLVAGTIEKLYNLRQQSDVQFAEATITDGLDDVHSAILVDGDTRVMVRAWRRDSQAAMTQKGADWTVHDVGTRVRVTDAIVEREGDLDWETDVETFCESWANSVIGDAGNGDELRLDGPSLTLYNPYTVTKINATIELVNDK